MKIALITEHTEIGGGESNLISLACELNKRANVTIFCSGRVKKLAEEKGISTIEFKTGKKWFKSLPLLNYNKALLKELDKFNIVHAYSVNTLPSIFFCRSKKIWTVHGFWERPFGLKGFFIDKMVDKVICVSTDVCKVASFNKQKKIKIFLGTSIECKEKNKVCKFDINNIMISCIGRFQYIKGQDLLIDALASLSKEINSKITLRFIGDVNGNNIEDYKYKESVLLKAKAASSVNLEILFEGFANDVSKYIKNSDFIVIPSRYESFSMVAIESLGCGKPVVAPNIGGPVDIVKSKKVGLLFEPGDKEDLKRKIKDAIYNFFIFDSEACRNVAKEFSVVNQAEKHLVLYQSLFND